MSGIASSAATRRIGFQKCRAAIARCGDVEHDEFVGALGVVARGERDRIASVAQADKVDAFDDAFAVGIEAGNDAASEAHAMLMRRCLKKFCSSRAPAAPLFSGWNCAAKIIVVRRRRRIRVPCSQVATSFRMRTMHVAA